MEVLSRQLIDAEARNLLHGIKISRNAPPVSHLLFADDSLLFARANRGEVGCIKTILRIFSEASGQCINFEKSGVIFSKNLDSEFCDTLTSELGISHLLGEDKYLGTPLVIGKSKICAFHSLIARLGSKIAGWKGKLLSQAGRTVLVKAVTSALATYQMSSFVLPKWIHCKLDAIQRDFWWGKGDKKGCYLKSWSSICLSKLRGGLGFRNSENFNLALIAKVGWRLIKNPDSLCAKVLRAKYYPDGNILYHKNVSNHSWVWGGILKGLNVLKHNVVWEVGDGKNIHIWTDIWLPDSSLVSSLPDWNVSLGPQLVSQLFHSDSRVWNRMLLERIFEPATVELICSIPLSPTRTDCIHWKLSKDGLFSVKSAYHSLTPSQENADIQLAVRAGQRPWKIFWKMKVHPRAQLFAWKCLARALPVSEYFERILGVLPTACCLCNTGNETLEHILYFCPFVKAVWLRGPTRAILQDTSNLNIEEWIWSWFTSGNFTNLERVKWVNYCMLTMWVIWKHRCEIMFQGSEVNLSATVSKLDLLCMDPIHTGDSPSNSTEVEIGVPVAPLCWRPPVFGSIKINVDAAFSVTNGFCGLGIVARDYTGSFVGGCSVRGLASSAEEAEGLAALHGVRWALSMGFDQFVLEMDALVVVNFLKYDTGYLSWRTKTSLLEIISLVKDLVYFDVHFVPRHCNMCADALAALGQSQSMGNPITWDGVPPDLITGLLYLDMVMVDSPGFEE